MSRGKTAFRQLVLLRLLGLGLLRRDEFPNAFLLKSSLLTAYLRIGIYVGQQITIALQYARRSSSESNIIGESRKNGRVGQIGVVDDLATIGSILGDPALQLYKQTRVRV
jgi:hypothetical protein